MYRVIALSVLFFIPLIALTIVPIEEMSIGMRGMVTGSTVYAVSRRQASHSQSAVLRCSLKSNLWIQLSVVLSIIRHQAPWPRPRQAAWESGCSHLKLNPILVPTAARSEDPSGLLRIPQVLRRM